MENINQADIVLIDLFSGVGGFHKAFEESGFNITHCYFSEIDKYAISVYKHHFKEAIYVGSVVDVSGTEIRRRHPNARIVICFGWPCQSNSVLGNRAGLSDGSKSGLLYQAVRVIQEAQPFCFFAENVRGLYSVNEGIDFIESLKILSYLNSDSPQYIVEQQLLDTLLFLPQSRQRTYFVGYPSGSGFQQILPIREGISGNEAPGKNQKSRLASVCRALTTKGGNRYDYETESYIEERDGRIRNLTHIERERLQGFPDGWCEYGINDKGETVPISSTQQYKQMGNAISIPVAKYVALAAKSKLF